MMMFVKLRPARESKGWEGAMEEAEEEKEGGSAKPRNRLSAKVGPSEK